MSNTNSASVEFTILQSLVNTAYKRVERITGRAAKLGRDDWAPVLTLVGDPEHVKQEDGTVQIFQTIKIEFPEIELGDWRVIGRADLLNAGTDGNAVVSAMADKPVPADAWNVTNKCDHCGWERKRKVAYVLEHKETEEIKRVGSSCLDKFVQSANLGLIRQLEALVVWGEAAQTKREDPLPEAQRFLVTDYLAAVCMVIDAFGYAKRSDVPDLADQRVFASWRIAWCAWMRAGVARESFIPERYMQQAWVLHDWALELSDETSFERNVRAIFSQISLTSEEMFKHAGVIASVVPSFFGYMDDREAWSAQLAEEEAKHIARREATAGTIRARWFRMRNGDWGVAAATEQRLRDGDRVTVVTRRGKEQIVTVRRVLFSGHDRITDKQAQFCSIHN